MTPWQDLERRPLENRRCSRLDAGQRRPLKRLFDGVAALETGCPQTRGQLGIARQEHARGVDKPNTAPLAADDTASTGADSAVGGNVLANDSDPDGDPLTVVAVNGNAGAVGSPVTLASGAILVLNADGTYSYDPNGRFDGLETGETATDSFAYTVSDGSGGSTTANVTVAVEGEDEEQKSTGGKQRLGKSSKMGQRDARRLLILGAMAVVQWASRKGVPNGSWPARMMAKKPRMLVAIALAKSPWPTRWRGESGQR